MTIRSLLVFIFLLTAVRPLEARQAEDPFAWDDATIYRIVTDRFSNGDSANDGAYGRGLDGNGTPYDPDSAGHFLGGDFRGITGWIRDGYFSNLGVNTLQVSAPFEQVHGWTGRGETQRYAFDGSMPLDYTSTDEAFGSAEDFANMVESARAAGLRVLIEVRLRGPGPVTLHDMVAHGFGSVADDTWRSWRGSSSAGEWNEAQRLFIRKDVPDSVWANWWGAQWVRADLPGYEPCEGECPPSGVQFRVESDSLPLPDFLQRKWGPEETDIERAALDAWFSRTGYPRAGAYAVVKWISDWVREYGIDGVVVEDADSVDPGLLEAMQREGETALADWRHGRSVAAERAFWLVGCGAATAVDATCADLPSRMTVDAANAAFADRAASVVDAESIRTIAHLDQSTADTGQSDTDMLPAAAGLLLAPGPIAFTYGQEAGLYAGGPRVMDWVAADDSVRALWQALGSFRAAHPAVARGGHEVLMEQPLTFFRGVRIGQEVDRIVIVLGATGRTRLNVARIWPDDTALRDAMTGNIGLVTFGQVTMAPGPGGILLLEEVPE